LVESLQAERCRFDVAARPGVRGSLDAIVAALQQSLTAIEDEIAATSGRPGQVRSRARRGGAQRQP
jgi:hypothetical protein